MAEQSEAGLLRRTEIEITAELPGLEKKDVQLNVADNVLMIRGEKKNEREEKGQVCHAGGFIVRFDGA